MFHRLEEDVGSLRRSNFCVSVSLPMVMPLVLTFGSTILYFVFANIAVVGNMDATSAMFWLSRWVLTLDCARQGVFYLGDSKTPASIWRTAARTEAMVAIIIAPLFIYFQRDVYLTGTMEAPMYVVSKQQ